MKGKTVVVVVVVVVAAGVAGVAEAAVLITTRRRHLRVKEMDAAPVSRLLLPLDCCAVPG